ncbi:MAG: sigma 54-interacting transcriptional regulator [Bernardetiaceae bacterium]
MEKILISWACATDHQPNTSAVNTDGPTYSYHKNFYKQDNYDKHLLFSTGSEEESNEGIQALVNKIAADFPDHKIEVRFLGVHDVYNLTELKPKVEKVLLEHRRVEVDMLTTADTPVMSMALFVAHADLSLNSKLIQMKGDGSRIILDAAYVPQGTQALHVNERIDPNVFNEDYCYTQSIEPIYEKAAKRVAPAESVTVFISGETGTGKQHLAHYIHEHSPRRSKSFEIVSCAALNDEALHTRFFGNATEEGAFARCHGGTIMLDEVGDLSPYMQQMLLQVLHPSNQKQGGVLIHPIGAEPKLVDVRVIASSNRDLYGMCQRGLYRWDLFYRLMICELHLPPLRERGTKDLKTLFEYLIKKVGQEHGGKTLHYKSEVWDHLKNYSFPGNVRELLGIVQRFYIEVEPGGWISMDDFPPHFRRQVTVESDQYEVETIEDMEKIHIDRIMRKYKGKSTYVAKALGIQPATLYNKMRKFNLVRGDYTGK